MTRINSGIPVETLHRKHLLAEAREIIRVPNTIKSGKAVVKDIPKKFTLGKGHVKFFYDKLLFLRNRYQLLFEECIKRGYKVTNFVSAWDGVPEHLMNDWIPTEEAKLLLEERISERLGEILKKEKKISKEVL
jgi:hypothetical protein